MPTYIYNVYILLNDQMVKKLYTITYRINLQLCKYINIIFQMVEITIIN